MLQIAWFSKLIYFSFVECFISKYSKYYSEAFSNFSCKCPKILEALWHLPRGVGMESSKLCALCSTAPLGLHSWQDAAHTHQPLWCRFSLFPSWALPVLFAAVFSNGLRFWQGILEWRHLVLTLQSKWDSCLLLGTNMCNTTSISIKPICHSGVWRSTEPNFHLFSVCSNHLLALGGSCKYKACSYVLILHVQARGALKLCWDFPVGLCCLACFSRPSQIQPLSSNFLASNLMLLWKRKYSLTSLCSLFL